MAQVGREDANRLGVGFRLALVGKFRLDGRLQQSLEGIVDGGCHLLGVVALPFHEATVEAAEAALAIGCDAHAQDAFRLPTAQSQQAVGGATAEGLVEGKVVFVFHALFLFPFYYFGGQYRCQLERLAHDLACLLVLVDPFGNDVAGALQRLGVGCGRQGGACLQHQPLRQGLKAFAAGNLSAGHTLGLVGQVEVFHLGGVPRVGDALPQLGGQLSLFLDGL